MRLGSGLCLEAGTEPPLKPGLELDSCARIDPSLQTTKPPQQRRRHRR